MSITKQYLRLATLLGLLLMSPAVLSAAQPPLQNTQARDAAVAKVSRFLTDAGYQYRKTGDHTWVIEGQNRKPMLLAVGQEFVVVGIIVEVKQNLKPSADLYFKLLKSNHDFDYVKVGLDDDDDLFVRVEARLSTMDLAGFKALVQDVSKNAETLRTTIAPYLNR
jgi:hypothetical protein